MPAIFPIVLYNGQRPWRAPTSIKALIDLPYPDVMPVEAYPVYHVIDARRVPPEKLAKARGDAAYVIRGEQAKTGREIAEIGKEFIARHIDPDAANLDRAVITWLEERIKKVEPYWRSSKHKEQPAMMLMELLEKAQAEVQKYKHEARAEGLAEGRTEGRAEGLAEGEAKVMSCQRAGLLEMLALKFGEIPTSWQNAVARLNNPEQINNLTIAILKVHSQAEYEQLLRIATES